MNKIELKQILEQEGIPKCYYSLEGGMPNDAWCILEKYDVWETYYSERGMKFQIMEFKTEEEACERIYKLLTKLKDYL